MYLYPTARTGCEQIGYMINRVTLVGYLGADPEIRTFSSGSMVAKLRLATTENYQDRSGQWQEETQWHDVVVWRHLAEKVQRDAQKGALLYVEGKLTHRKWEDREGNARNTTEVVGAMVRVLDGRRGNAASKQEARPDETPTVTQHTSVSGSDGSGEDLPF